MAGASGRLGCRIMDIHGCDWEITGLSRGISPGTVRFDICSPDNLSLSGYDLVINCAAVSSTSDCSDDPRTAWVVNSLWPSWLASGTAALGIPLVHFSTDLVYSGGIPPYSEYTPGVPSRFYGWTKLLGDMAALRRNPLSVILRTSVLFGKSDQGNPTFSDDLLHGRLDRVFVDSFRHHTSLGWLAEVAGQVADTGFTGLVHAAGLHHQSRAAFAEELLRRRGKEPGELLLDYSPAGTPLNLSLDMNRACEVLPLRPLDLFESIEREYPSA